MGQGSDDTEHVWYAVPWRFVVESVIAVSVFTTIAVVAIGLSFATKTLEAWKVDPFIVYGLKGFEYFLFGGDLFLFGCFWIKAAFRTFKKM